MNGKRRVCVLLAVAVLALGATAVRVTRDEFDKLAAEVQSLRVKVAVMRLDMHKLQEPEPEPVEALPVETDEPTLRVKRLQLAPFAVPD